MSKQLVLAAFTTAILACLAAPASAHGLLMDPDGVSVWDQLLDWLTGDWTDEAGSSYDPNGRL
jgi:hypothetical protein